MAITIKEILVGLITQDATAYVNKIEDAIDGLSNLNVKTVDAKTIVEYIDIDGNSITSLGANGVVAGGSIADASDRVFKTVEITMPEPQVLTLKIGRQLFKKFGITPADLDAPAKRFGLANINSMVKSGALADELKKMYNDFYQNRRNQVHNFLATLATATATHNLTADGDKLVADNRTGNLYDFDNKGTSALSESEFKVALNAMAKQTDARGNEVGAVAPAFLFHTSNLTLANEILKPNEVVNAQYKSAGDFKQGVKMAGVYNNSTDSNDWVVLGSNAKVERYVLEGYETPKIRIAHDVINDIIILEMSDCSLIKCTSPEGIFGAIVA